MVRISKSLSVENIQFAAMLCLYRNNVAEEVDEALNAAFEKQEVIPDQLIVVFDGPVCDAVCAIIDQFELTHNVKRIVHEVCKGHGPARAAAINACSYDWIAIIDADDVSMPNRFSELTGIILQYPETAVVGGAITEFYVEHGVKVFDQEIKYPETPKAIRHYLASRSPIAQPTAMLRVAAVRAVGNYQQWFNNEDYHLWMRLVAAGFCLRNTRQTVLWFRTTPDLFVRRGGLRYWYNEIRLQLFSLRLGTTNLFRVLIGGFVRFIVQVIMPAQLRMVFYKRILRKL